MIHEACCAGDNAWRCPCATDSRAADEQHAADPGQRVQEGLRHGVYLLRQLPSGRNDDGAHLRPQMSSLKRFQETTLWCKCYNVCM